jgi:protein AFG1
LETYKLLRGKGYVHEDLAQAKTVERLDKLHSELTNYKTSWDQYASADTPEGLYIQGGVGCGKTFCMDMFFQLLNVDNKLRVHFHSFMLSVHKRLFELQKESGQDPLVLVAKEIADKASVICFDEFQVTDVADAMILKRLLETLVEHGVVLVMTSNRLPNELYLNGLNRVQFLPAIALIEEHCDLYPFPVDSPDYRLLGEECTSWVSPITETSIDKFSEKFNKLKKKKKVKTGVLEVQGRRVKIPAAVGGVAKFSFGSLCQEAKGAADYIAIANSYHTVFIEGIPKMNENNLPLVRRFITLVDVLYENHVKVVALAHASVPETYVPTEINESRDEDFAWDRTVSRLTEMQSSEYLKDPWRGGTGFLRRFEQEKLDEKDLKSIWSVYDHDNSGYLSLEELSMLIADVNEMKSGRRRVDQKEVEKVFNNVHVCESEGIEWEEFRAYFEKEGGYIHVMQSHYVLPTHCDPAEQ